VSDSTGRVDQTVTRFDRIDILVNSVIAVMKQSLKMSKKQEIVILGAGAVGCSIAYHLAKKGIRSTIIEKEAIGSRASGKAWAVISYPPCIMAMAQFSDPFLGMPDNLIVDSEVAFGVKKMIEYLSPD
jgi:hypothetical protein